MENNSISLAALANSANYSAMSYAELVELNLAYLWALGDIKKLMDVKRKEEMAIITREYVTKMKAYLAADDEILSCIEKEIPSGELVCSDIPMIEDAATDVEMVEVEAEMPDGNMIGVDDVPALPEHPQTCAAEVEDASSDEESCTIAESHDEEAAEPAAPKNGSAFDNPAVKVSFKSKHKKNADKATPETKETDSDAPADGASNPEPEEALPTMEELLCDDPMYKAHYAAPSPIQKSKMITMEELLSGEPVNEILNLGNLKPEDAPFRQHTRVCDASGICPTLTATGNTTNIYLGS